MTMADSLTTSAVTQLTAVQGNIGSIGSVIIAIAVGIAVIGIIKRLVRKA